MGNVLIGYENYADAALLSGGVWTIPLTTLQDPRPGRKARSSNASLSSTIVRADLGVARSLRVFALTHTNLTAVAQYRITWYSDEYSTEIGTTGWLGVPGYPADDPDFLGASIWHVFATNVSARYWKIEIDDQTNVAGVIEPGRLFLPEMWAPTINFAPGSNSDGFQVNTPEQEALGGYVYANRRTPRRTLRLTWPVLQSAETPIIRRIRRICNTNKQLIVIPDPDDVANYHERNFVAKLRVTPDIALYKVGYLATGFDFIEVVP